MTKIKLSKRLNQIANLVDKNSIVADIGCDHALLDIYLIQNKIIKKSYACDISSGALNQAKKNIDLCGTKNIEVRLGDGLEPININDKINTIILSGLGNQKIFQILSSDKEKLENIEHIIIQSNTKVSQIRNNIIKLGYYIKDEKLVEERNIIYTIIKFNKGKKIYNKRQITFGPILLKNKDDLFYKNIEQKINDNKKILLNMPKRKIFKRLEIYNKIRLLKKERSADV